MAIFLQVKKANGTREFINLDQVSTIMATDQGTVNFFVGSEGAYTYHGDLGASVLEALEQSLQRAATYRVIEEAK